MGRTNEETLACMVHYCMRWRSLDRDELSAKLLVADGGPCADEEFSWDYLIIIWSMIGCTIEPFITFHCRIVSVESSAQLQSRSSAHPATIVAYCIFPSSKIFHWQCPGQWPPIKQSHCDSTMTSVMATTTGAPSLSRLIHAVSQHC